LASGAVARLVAPLFGYYDFPQKLTGIAVLLGTKKRGWRQVYLPPETIELLAKFHNHCDHYY
jgi:hypothetical protein